jgi:hypothetical protein
MIWDKPAKKKNYNNEEKIRKNPFHTTAKSF